MNTKTPFKIAAKTLSFLLITTSLIGCYEPGGSTKVRKNPVQGPGVSGVNKTQNAEQIAPTDLSKLNGEEQPATTTTNQNDKANSANKPDYTKSNVLRNVPVETLDSITLQDDFTCFVTKKSSSAWSSNGPKIIKGTTKSFAINADSKEPQTFKHKSEDINFSYEITVAFANSNYYVSALKLNDGDDKDSFSYELKQTLATDGENDSLGEAVLKYEVQNKPQHNFGVTLEGDKLTQSGLALKDKCLEPKTNLKKIDFCAMADREERLNHVLTLKGSSIIEVEQEISLAFDFQNSGVLGSDRMTYTLTCKY
jgi:hypothetical protein